VSRLYESIGQWELIHGNMLKELQKN